eukprot:scaffold3831_cov112-Isochrysis_galbana.AAC.3
MQQVVVLAAVLANPAQHLVEVQQAEALERQPETPQPGLARVPQQVLGAEGSHVPRRFFLCFPCIGSPAEIPFQVEPVLDGGRDVLTCVEDEFSAGKEHLRKVEKHCRPVLHAVRGDQVRRGERRRAPSDLFEACDRELAAGRSP